MNARHCRHLVGIVGLVSLMTLVAIVGCRKESGPADTPKLADAPKLSDTPDPAQSAEVIAKLVKADLVDGTEDKVVHRCASCRLGMDGDEKNALTVGEYQMHFCSADCKDRFAKDPSANILALAIPEAGE